MLMYREIANEKYETILGSAPITINEKQISVLKNVEAGYIKNEGGKYYIYETVVDKIKENTFGEMNYYVLSTRTILDNKENYPFFTENPSKYMMYTLDCEFNEEEKDGKIHYVPKDKIAMVNNAYKAFFKEVSYEIANLKNITAVGKPGIYKNSGYVISTGNISEKKVLYIIPEIDMKKERIEISEEDIVSFKVDMNNRENTLKRFGGKEFFDLPESGKLKPVFYIRHGGKLYFGFTPRLRLFYNNKIKAGLPKEHKRVKLDYAKAMFGYSNKDDSYKSRISFADAITNEESNNKEKKEIKLILAGPKPTSYMDYLIQDGKNGVTYDTEGFKLRGVKQYWLKKDIVEVQDNGNEKVATTFKPLDKGVKFTGKVRFKNLKEEELGLLLWSIKLEKNSWLNVGKAKPYGYGNISIEIKNVKMLNFEKAYKSLELDLSPFEVLDEKEIENKIEVYKKVVNKKLNGRKIEQLSNIEEFFKMKNSEKIPDNDKTRYMKIRNENKKNEYQNRKQQALPSIKEVLGE